MRVLSKYCFTLLLLLCLTGVAYAVEQKATGTYVYDSDARTLEVTIETSTYQCDGPVAGDVYNMQDVTITPTELTWTEIWEGELDIMTWERADGVAGDILGEWFRDKDGDIETLTFLDSTRFEIIGPDSSTCGGEDILFRHVYGDDWSVGYGVYANHTRTVEPGDGDIWTAGRCIGEDCHDTYEVNPESQHIEIQFTHADSFDSYNPINGFFFEYLLEDAGYYIKDIQIDTNMVGWDDSRIYQKDEFSFGVNWAGLSHTPDTYFDIRLEYEPFGYDTEYLYTSTLHELKNGRSSTNASVGFENIISPEGDRILRDVVSSMVVTTPSGTCTEKIFEGYNLWRLSLRDSDRNGIIEESEWEDLRAVRGAETWCPLDTVPHQGGDYQLAITLNDGSVLEKGLTNVPAGLTWEDFPPVENLLASWDNDSREMHLSWMRPIEYHPDDKLQIRVYPFNNGQWQNAQLRVRDLPSNLESFTLTKEMTEVFDIPAFDQLKIQIRMYSSQSSTQSRTSKTYSFDSRTGSLVEAEIKPTLFDINGDNKTGLEEAIYSLQAVSGQ